MPLGRQVALEWEPKTATAAKAAAMIAATDYTHRCCSLTSNAVCLWKCGSNSSFLFSINGVPRRHFSLKVIALTLFKRLLLGCLLQVSVHLLYYIVVVVVVAGAVKNFDDVYSNGVLFIWNICCNSSC